MNVKRLFFWAALFLALLVYVVYFEKPEPKKVAAKPGDFGKVLPVNPEELVRIDIAKGGKTASLVKKGDRWEVAVPAGMETQEGLLAGVAESLTGAVNLGVVEENPASLEQFGLSKPQLTVSVFKKKSTTPVKLLIGSNSPSGVSVYAKIESENRVMLAGTYLTFSLNMFMNNIR